MTILKVKDLHKTYPNGVKAVQDLNIEINKGEVFGFLGPNGAGKSTSIHMMTGLISPSSGTINVLGYNLPEQSKQLAPEIGFVPQSLIFYEHLTVHENLELFASCYELKNSRERIKEIMKILQIDDLQNRRAGKMSGGQKRRLNLAIGLLHTPRLIFLDEPSAGMDPQSRNVLWDSIEKLSQDEGITIILTTHLMETAERLSDRIAIIDHGTVQVIDTPQNLKKKYGKGDTVVFDFKPELCDNDLEKIIESLKLIFIKDQIFVSDKRLKISNGNGIDTIITATSEIEKIIDRGLIQEISMRDSTIEDVFLKITGRELRE